MCKNQTRLYEYVMEYAFSLCMLLFTVRSRRSRIILNTQKLVFWGGRLLSCTLGTGSLSERANASAPAAGGLLWRNLWRRNRKTLE